MVQDGPQTWQLDSYPWDFSPYSRTGERWCAARDGPTCGALCSPCETGGLFGAAGQGRPVNKEQMDYLERMPLHTGLANKQAPTEKIRAWLVCICTRIREVMVGPPGHCPLYGIYSAGWGSPHRTVWSHHDGSIVAVVVVAAGLDQACGDGRWPRWFAWALRGGLRTRGWRPRTRQPRKNASNSRGCS